MKINWIFQNYSIIQAGEGWHHTRLHLGACRNYKTYMFPKSCLKSLKPTRLVSLINIICTLLKRVQRCIKFSGNIVDFF